MRSGIKVWGRRIPAWLLILALIAAGAGAATGTVLATKITAKIPVTVDQAIVLGAAPTVSGADNSIATKSDDNTAFTAGMELNNGDSATVALAIQNKSSASMVVKLTLWGVPSGATLSVSSSDDASNVTRVGKYTWLFNLAANSDNTADITITVALADDMKPGFYEINGKIEPVNY